MSSWINRSVIDFYKNKIAIHMIYIILGQLSIIMIGADI